MTGTVEWGVLIWLATTIIGAVVLTWRIVAWVNAEFDKRDAAILKVEREAALSIGIADARAKMAEEELRRSLDAHKLYAAEHYATNDDVVRAVDKIDGSIKDLSARIDQHFRPATPPP